MQLTSKILKEAYAQQREVENEENAETIPMIAFFKRAVYGLEDTIDDVDELSETQSQLYYQVRLLFPLSIVLVFKSLTISWY